MPEAKGPIERGMPIDLLIQSQAMSERHSDDAGEMGASVRFDHPMLSEAT